MTRSTSGMSSPLAATSVATSTPHPPSLKLCGDAHSHTHTHTHSHLESDLSLALWNVSMQHLAVLPQQGAER